jgi:uncharacterized repeat protein (TIGR03803 family)
MEEEAPSMSGKFLSLKMTFVIGVMLCATGKPLSAQQERTIHSFGKRADGNTVYSGVISDSAGNLYGTTYGGGTFPAGEFGAGVVYELLRQPDGSWTEEILHDFGQGTDGRGPTAGLVFDAAGNLYGATRYGGGTNCLGGCGVVYELQPPATQGGSWTEAVLYRFQDNGVNPQGSLIVDSVGDLFGVTQNGGAAGFGIVFELAPQSSGPWMEKIVHTFRHNGTDGNNPNDITRDSSGNLYGTTSAGGAHNWGTVFEISPQAGGGWSEKVLYSFNSNGSDGNLPAAGVTFGAGGSLFGTTSQGGLYNYGTVFQLTPSEGGVWSESVLHSFGGSTDGMYPGGTVTLDSAGNIYGETTYGGTRAEGTVFELTRSGVTWTESVLHNFGNGTDGMFPQGNLIFDHAGNLYGTSILGGAYFGDRDNGGTVFQLRTK